jgi:hypothetical protein
MPIHNFVGFKIADLGKITFIVLSGATIKQQIISETCSTLRKCILMCQQISTADEILYRSYKQIAIATCK